MCEPSCAYARMRVDELAIVSHNLLPKPVLTVDHVIRAVFYTDDPSQRLFMNFSLFFYRLLWTRFQNHFKSSMLTRAFLFR